jgi:thiamine kinase-like enzyme
MSGTSIDDVVAGLWPGSEAVIQPLSGGITNSNYRVDVAEGSFAVRLVGDRTELLGIDRQSEVDACRLAAGLRVGPELTHVDLGLGVVVTSFLVGRAIAPEEVGEEPLISEIADVLRKVHAAGVVAATFNTFELVPMYGAIGAESGVDLPFDYEAMLESLERIALARPWRPEALCHNDLLNSNLLYDGSLRIVDWEYAGMGDRFFDLGNLAVNHEFTPSQDEALLRHYFGDAGPSELATLQLFKLVSEAREAMWGVAQAAISTLEVDFKQYAATHAARYFEILEALNFAETLRLAALSSRRQLVD